MNSINFCKNITVFVNLKGKNRVHNIKMLFRPRQNFLTYNKQVCCNEQHILLHLIWLVIFPEHCKRYMEQRLIHVAVLGKMSDFRMVPHIQEVFMSF